MRSKTDKQTVTEIIERYQAGESVKLMAEQYSLNTSTIHRILKRNSIPPKNTALTAKAGKRLTASEIAEMIQLYKDEMLVEDIIERIGCSKPTLYYYIKKEGLSRELVADKDKVAEAIRLYTETDLPIQDILDRSGISRATLYRRLKKINANMEG